MKHVQSYLYQLIGRDSPETAEIYATGDMAMACHGLMRGVAQIDIGIRDSQLAHELWCWLKPYPIPLIMPNTGVMINLGPQPSPADMPTAIQFAGKQTKMTATASTSQFYSRAELLAQYTQLYNMAVGVGDRDRMAGYTDRITKLST